MLSVCVCVQCGWCESVCRLQTTTFLKLFENSMFEQNLSSCFNVNTLGHPLCFHCTTQCVRCEERCVNQDFSTRVWQTAMAAQEHPLTLTVFSCADLKDLQYPVGRTYVCEIFPLNSKPNSVLNRPNFENGYVCSIGGPNRKTCSGSPPNAMTRTTVTKPAPKATSPSNSFEQPPQNLTLV